MNKQTYSTALMHRVIFLAVMYAANVHEHSGRWILDIEQNELVDGGIVFG